MFAEAVLLLKLSIAISLSGGFAVIGESGYEYESLKACQADGKLVVDNLKEEFPDNEFYSFCEVEPQKSSHM